MTNNTKRDSPLVDAVLALQNHFTELERIGQKINAADLTGDVDLEYIQKLLARFAECGQGISTQVNELSVHLKQATTRAESVAQGVSRQAEMINNLRKEHNDKLEQFRLLGERVRELNGAISHFNLSQGLTDESRAALAARIPGLSLELTSLIEELQALRNSARSSRMRALEKNAESLAQSLQAVHTRLRELHS
jgi:chromosome segregation ATPase